MPFGIDRVFFRSINSVNLFKLHRCTTRVAYLATEVC
jgi:hypothetical protein